MLRFALLHHCRMPFCGGYSRVPLCLKPLSAVLLLAFLFLAWARPAAANYSVAVLSPTGGGHSGCALNVTVRLTQTSGDGFQWVKDLKVVSGEDVLIDTTGPFYFNTDPNDPTIYHCYFNAMVDAHNKVSPGNYGITATATYITAVETYVGDDENGYPIFDYSSRRP